MSTARTGFTALKQSSERVLSEPGENGPFFLRPAQCGPYCSLLQDEQGRDAADAEPAGQNGVFLGIDLYDCCHAGKLSGNFPHRRCEVSAVRSPGSPELGENRARVAGNEGIEASVGQFYRLKVKRGEQCMAIAAFARSAFFGGGYAVGCAAGGAGNQVGGSGFVHDSSSMRLGGQNDSKTWVRRLRRTFPAEAASFS